MKIPFFLPLPDTFGAFFAPPTIARCPTPLRFLITCTGSGLWPHVLMRLLRSRFGRQVRADLRLQVRAAFVNPGTLNLRALQEPFVPWLFPEAVVAVFSDLLMSWHGRAPCGSPTLTVARTVVEVRGLAEGN